MNDKLLNEGESVPSDAEIAQLAYNDFGIVADDAEVVAFARAMIDAAIAAMGCDKP